jgi:hypothetical protein
MAQAWDLLAAVSQGLDASITQRESAESAPRMVFVDEASAGAVDPLTVSRE